MKFDMFFFHRVSRKEKKNVYFSRWKSEEVAADTGKLYLKDISERKLLRYVS